MIGGIFIVISPYLSAQPAQLFWRPFGGIVASYGRLHISPAFNMARIGTNNGIPLCSQRYRSIIISIGIVIGGNNIVRFFPVPAEQQFLGVPAVLIQLTKRWLHNYT
ncbi:hypothetical protein D3C87_1413870 [compost metagenome]